MKQPLENLEKPLMYRPLVTAPHKIEVALEELPTDLGSRQVLCRTRRSLVSTGTELSLFRGEALPEPLWGEFSDLNLVTSYLPGQGSPAGGRDPRFPATLGYNNVAEVVAAGPSVTTLKPGDVVVSTARHQSHFIVEEWEAVPVPDDVTDEAATFAYLGTLGLHALRACGFQPGQSVLVVGLGPVGASAAAVALACGAASVAAVDVSAERRSFVKRALPQVEVLPPDARSGPAEWPRSVADIVLEAAGSPAALSFSIEAVRPSGHVGVMALHKGELGEVLGESFYSNRPAIISCGNDPYRDPASAATRFTIPENIAFILELTSRGHLDLSVLVTDRASAMQLEPVYRWLSQSRTSSLGTIIEWPEQDSQ